MRVVEVIPSLSPVGGAENFVATLSLAFKKSAEVDVIVICLYPCNGNDYLGKKLVENGIQVIYLNKHKGFDWKNSRLFRKTLRDLKPDIIHFHLKSIMTAFLASAWDFCPCFVTIHNTVNAATYGNKFSPQNLVSRYLFKAKKIVPIAISHLVKNSAADYFGLSDVPTIFNGIDIEKFDHSIPFEKRKYDFVFLGRFVEFKNPLYIIRAFEKVAEVNRSITLIMIGDGPLLSECVHYVKEHGIKNVSLIGRVDEPATYLKDCRCLVMASQVEGNPIAINEAIACGAFVLAPKVGGVPELLINGSGRCYEYNKISLADDLAENMKWFLQTPSLSIDLSNNLLDNIARVSIDEKARAYLKLFSRRLKNP